MISGTDYFHLLPVVGKLFTTIQAHDVRASSRCLVGTIRLTGLDRDWKRAVLVRTAEQCIDESRHLIPPPAYFWRSLVPDENEPTLVAKVSVVH